MRTARNHLLGLERGGIEFHDTGSALITVSKIRLPAGTCSSDGSNMWPRMVMLALKTSSARAAAWHAATISKAASMRVALLNRVLILSMSWEIAS